MTIQRPRPFRPAVEALEDRQLLSAAGIGLTGRRPAGTITADAKQPLAPNAALIQSSRGHSADMLARDYFAHETLGTGQTPDQREAAAGYSGSAFAENIAERGTSG